VIIAWAFLLAAASLGNPSGPWLEVVREPGAESCPDAGSLARSVEAELGRAVTGRAVRCVVGREGRGWRARITIDGEGQGAAAVRTVRADGADCRALGSTLELTLTLALALAPAPAPAAASPVPQVADGELPAGLATRPPEREVGAPWSGSAGAVLGIGALLDFSTGLELGGRWRHGRLMLAMEGRVERALPGRQGPAKMEGWRASGAFLPCLAPGALGFCGVVRGGGFTARSEGLAVSRTGRGILAEAGARAAWQLGRGVLAGVLYLEATAPLVRTRLLVDAHPSWASPPVVFSVGVAAVMGR
jgi:hypothetical protein